VRAAPSSEMESRENHGRRLSESDVQGKLGGLLRRQSMTGFYSRSGPAGVLPMASSAGAPPRLSARFSSDSFTPPVANSTAK
jgi:hypothetical protein